MAPIGMQARVGRVSSSKRGLVGPEQLLPSMAPSVLPQPTRQGSLGDSGKPLSLLLLPAPPTQVPPC